MKVDKNQTLFPCNPSSVPQFAGIPIRLEIAARILASSNPIGKDPNEKASKTVKSALEWADALIAAHNEDQ